MGNNSNMIRPWLILAVAFITLPCAACLWDRDTLADEARYHDNIVDVMTGRFPRNPPLYYEMRLNQVQKELEKTPQNLDLYDDAGVACVRLDRVPEAIQWMEKKHNQLKKAPVSSSTTDHWYRYYSNLGTIKTYEWLRNGADLNHTGTLREGIVLIKDALDLNPNAHFGREEYQLKLMEWIVSNSPSPITDSTISNYKYYPNFLGLKPESEYKNKELKKASKGVSGLITLGLAWESIDVFVTLTHIHGKLDNTSIAYLAQSRTKELLETGKLPLLTKDLTTKTLESFLHGSGFAQRELQHPVPYPDLRANADKWQEHRTNYMIERMKRGLHPDTDKHFWDDYKEIPAMSLLRSVIPGTNIKIADIKKLKIPIGAAIILISTALTGTFMIRRRKKRNGAGDRT